MSLPPGQRPPGESLQRIIGKSPALKCALARLSRYALSSGPLLILGESGTGKELAARAAHELGPRKGESFVPVNCGAIPDTLLEGELFGYSRGAFTGAFHDHCGKFELANKGTIFLDEIGNTSASMQAKVLRVLDDGEVYRLGDNRRFEVNVRVICATNLDLIRAVKDGRFREDLYYRLRVHRVTLPPLRDRNGDTAPLLQYFLTRYAAESDKVGITFSAAATSALLNYAYPGNVRELKSIVQDSVVLADPPTIELDDLPEEVLDVSSLRVPPDDRAGLLALLQEEDWNIEAVARRLGLTARAVSYRMDKLDIKRP